MKTAPFDAADLAKSVIAVPPLARDSQALVCEAENRKLIRFLEDGGVRSLLYGGNAVLYHTSLTEYDAILRIVSEASGSETVVVPSFGPSYGIACDQVDRLKEHGFPTAMLLPSRDIVDSSGIAVGIRRLVDRYGKPIVLYLKHDRWMDPQDIESLERDGCLSWIKYAVVREDPSNDEYLNEVINVFPKERLVSGIGEQPAIVHLNQFGITGFTSGCVCVAPSRSMAMLRAIQSGDLGAAESIRQYFRPLEYLRDSIHPIRVLHAAVQHAGIAVTGEIQPMLSDVDAATQSRILEALQTMGVA
ncbi:MAG: dihydrodipicolinate synthase family protein [Planctomycetota bacterium]